MRNQIHDKGVESQDTCLVQLEFGNQVMSLYIFEFGNVKLRIQTRNELQSFHSTLSMKELENSFVCGIHGT